MEQVRMGIIGIGNMGTGHIENVKLAGNMVLTAIADINPARLEWAREHCPGVALFDDGVQLMDSGLVDAVIVATPHYDHPVLAAEALKRGIHVMNEKPAGVYTKAVRELNELAARSDATYAIMFCVRTNCLYRKMKEIIDSGEMGKIRRATWIITDWYRPQSYYDSGSWRATWSGEGGGVLMNQDPHQLDLFQWIVGMPSKVRAFCHEGKWHDIEVEDDVTAYFEFPNGATGAFITTTGERPGTNRFEVSLDGGKLVVENGKLMMHKLEMFEQDFSASWKNGFGQPKCEVTEVETDGSCGMHVEVLRVFGEHILHGTPLIAEGAEGIHGLTLANAMYLSSWLSKEVDLPLDEDLFLAELNKRRATSRRKEGESVTMDTAGTYST